MSTLRPITDELINEANKIIEKNTKEKEQYLKENLGGSISDAGVKSVAENLYGNKTDFDWVLNSLRFQRWETRKLTDEQVLNIFNCNSGIETYLKEQSWVDDYIEMDIKSGTYTEKEMELNIDEDGNLLSWYFNTDKDGEAFWIDMMRKVLDNSRFEEDENINSYEELYEVISKIEDFSDGWEEEE